MHDEFLLFLLSYSEVRARSAEQRALKAEETLHAALEKIQDLERQLQIQTALEPQSEAGKTLLILTKRDMSIKGCNAFFMFQRQRRHHLRPHQQLQHQLLQNHPQVKQSQQAPPKRLRNGDLACGLNLWDYIYV
ncbi:hypothetical protein ILYODFUR_027819 [Ilyodon furcidens]|uniref:Uncharacterized protein n=1 Tax=Ilyodon furcidens TaxID=33524 RepID=A0ABV0VKH3_9TELE